MDCTIELKEMGKLLRNCTMDSILGKVKLQSNPQSDHFWKSGKEEERVFQIQEESKCTEVEMNRAFWWGRMWQTQSSR